MDCTLGGFLGTLLRVVWNPVQCTRPRISILYSRAEDVKRLYHPFKSNYVPQVRRLEGLSSDRVDSVIVDIDPLTNTWLAEEMALIIGYCLLYDILAVIEKQINNFYYC